MKRIIILFLFVYLMFGVCNAMAENIVDVKLPGGLKFGMTMDEAIAISGYNKTGDSLPDQSMLPAMGFDKTGYLLGSGRIGGFEATIQVFFVNNSLKQVMYTFANQEVDGSHTGIEPVTKASYDAVEKVIGTKYAAAANDDKAKHQYSPRYIKYTWYYKMTRERTRGSGSPQTTYITKLPEGGTVYIDDYVTMHTLTPDALKGYGTEYVYHHEMTYTYYDYQLDDDADTSNDVDF